MAPEVTHLATGHTAVEYNEEEIKNIQKHYKLFQSVVKIRPGNYFFPKAVVGAVERLDRFTFRPDDVWVLTFPKCGTTWLQEIAWTLLFNPNFDNPQADDCIDIRSPPIDVDFMISDTTGRIDEESSVMKAFKKYYPGRVPVKDGFFMDLADSTPSPRVLKVHLPFSLQPEDILERTKVIYVARDPRDVIVSYYYFCQLHKAFEFHGTLSDFVSCFLKGEVVFCPIFNHIKDAWDRRHHPNLLFVFYEDLMAQPEVEFKRINEFMGTNRTDEEIKKIIDFTSFDSMKKRMETGKADPPSSNFGKFYKKEVVDQGIGFFRKGKVGDWKDKFTSEEVERITEWMKKETSIFGKEFKYYTE